MNNYIRANSVDIKELQTKLKKRNCQIADLKHRIKEIEKKLRIANNKEVFCTCGKKYRVVDMIDFS